MAVKGRWKALADERRRLEKAAAEVKQPPPPPQAEARPVPESEKTFLDSLGGDP